MFKKMFRLLTVFVGFVVLFVMPNQANATVQSDMSLAELNSQVSFSPVNLNVYGSSLELTNKSSNSLFDHLGCNCGICTQQSNQQQNL